MSVMQQRLRHAGQRCRGSELGDNGVDLSLALARDLLLDRDGFDRLRCAHTH
jgi:hypothetical protein